MSALTEAPRTSWTLPVGVGSTVALVTVAAAWLTVIGSDALWLSALGDEIRRSGAVPAGIPFAAAESGGWVNTTALGQLLFSYAFELGGIGIVVAQVMAASITLAVLARDAISRGARTATTCLVLVAVAAGAATPLLIARAQLLSLVPYAVLLVLVRRQHDRPTRSVWWAVPLIALWGNLHGGVLVGIAVLGCYLVFSRIRETPATAIGVGLSALVAACLNPGLLGAPSYYVGVFGGEATKDVSGMWSRISPGNPFDVLLVLAGLVLLALALRRRLPLWEYVAVLGLVGATASAARHGVWLLLFLAVPATTGSAGKPPEEGSARPQTARGPVATALPLVVGVLVAATALVLRAPGFADADRQAARVAGLTQGKVVLAPEPLAESLAAASARVWASNPMDAFSTGDQSAYLAFQRADGAGAQPALASADVVVVDSGSEQERIARAAGFTQATTDGALVMLVRP